jgi:hypothetical protein
MFRLKESNKGAVDDGMAWHVRRGCLVNMNYRLGARLLSTLDFLNASSGQPLLRKTLQMLHICDRFELKYGTSSFVASQ